MPVLPSAAWDHKPYDAHWHVRDKVTPITFTQLYWGDIEQEPFGYLSEVADKVWMERSAGAIHTYAEVLETPDRVVLYDEARDRTVTIDWSELDLTVVDDGVETLYTVIGFAHGVRPFVHPDFIM